MKIIEQIKQQAIQKQAENKKFFAKLKQKAPKNLDYITQEIHQEITEKTDCLQCANCCKTTSPLLTNADIERISKHLKIKQINFTQQYTRIDEDNDFVFNQTPCPFLLGDNFCLIYDVRPKACREYPHTDRKKIYQIAKITIENTKICPIAYEVIEKMKSKIQV